MDSFQSPKSIKTRDELTTIWNYWVAKERMLRRQAGTEDERNEIDEYLNKQLAPRDKELIALNRSKQAKERMTKKEAEKLVKEEEELKYQANLTLILKEKEQYKKRQEEAKEQITEMKRQLNPLEEELARICEKFGLESGMTDIKTRLETLEKEVSCPLKTSCKHMKKINTACDSWTGTYTYHCPDCNSKWSVY
jgi:chromosome segregation ATPase